MAARVARAMRERRVLLAEAGTGTGKTVAYLVPALLFGGKVIISTGTKTLQDQLFHRDLPAVREGARGAGDGGAAQGPRQLRLPLPSRAQPRGRPLRHPRGRRATCSAIARFAAQTRTGRQGGARRRARGFAGLAARDLHARELPRAASAGTTTACFVMKARRDALAADVVVVNHHLFFADVMLRDEGMAELLPACNTVILDEAHQLPETATAFFGETVSTGPGARPLPRHARRKRCRRRATPRELPELASARREGGAGSASRGPAQGNARAGGCDVGERRVRRGPERAARARSRTLAARARGGRRARRRARQLLRAAPPSSRRGSSAGRTATRRRPRALGRDLHATRLRCT